MVLSTQAPLEMFVTRDDREFFLSLVERLVGECDLRLHAYSLLSHSFAFLATPLHSEALPRFMQKLARSYVAYYNKSYAHSGALFARRYRSALVSSEYAYDVIKRIETMPLALESALVEPHAAFDPAEYKKRYGELLAPKTLAFIESRIEKSQIIGSGAFAQSIEEKTGMSLYPKERGRPKKRNLNKRMSMSMYKNLVVLDREGHKSLKISPMENLFFARELSSVALTHSEVEQVAKDFAVVFTNGERASLVTLVSLGQTNLAINDEGKWLAPYVPAALRKYPFALVKSETEEDKSVIVIDEDAEMFSKTKGKALFEKSGENSATLEEHINLASVFEKETQTTLAAVEEIRASGVLVEKEVRVNTENESKVLVNGFSAVDEEKLAALDMDTLERWEKSGIMALIKAHLTSLDKIQNLFVLAKSRQA